MKILTIVFGILLTISGVWNYTATGTSPKGVGGEGVWALMPVVFGLLVTLFGFLHSTPRRGVQGRWPNKHALYGAIMLAIITLIGSIRAMWNLVLLLIGGELALSTELIMVRSLRGILSLVFILLALALIENFRENWKAFGQFLGNWLARAVLTIFYFTVLVPFGVGVRLLADPLHLALKPSPFWRPRATGDQNLEDVLRQF